MFTFLLEHFLLSGTALVAGAAFVAVGLLGGWPLVLNRYAIGALVAVLVGVGLLLGWTALTEHWEARGARALEEANRQAREQRQRQNAAFDQDLSDLAKEQQERLMRAREALDRIRAERRSNVSQAADAGCRITRGFVHDHDRDVPGAAGRPEVPIATADVDQPAAGVVLSRVGRCVGSNYTECAKLQRELATCEEKRYAACLAWDKRYGTQSNCAR